MAYRYTAWSTRILDETAQLQQAQHTMTTRSSEERQEGVSWYADIYVWLVEARAAINVDGQHQLQLQYQVDNNLYRLRTAEHYAS